MSRRVLVKQGNKFITVDNVKAGDGEIQAGQGSTVISASSWSARRGS